jgi:predicted ATPase/class 3 adenylate cyclase/DNA-binding winged helix-turn-helix (wHTH) protein
MGPDGALGLGGKKERTVLAVLVLNANQVVSASRLAEALWGDRWPPTATKTVQNYILRLRRALAGASELEIETRGGGYMLALAPEATDVAEVEVLRRQARVAEDAGDHTQAARLLREALTRFRGEPLEEFMPAAFVVGQATRLEELHQVLFDELIEAELAAGHHAEIVGELDDQVRASPLRERRWAQLMVALYRCHRQADALRAYQRARTVLVEDLGVEPGSELRDLEAAVLSQDSALDLLVNARGDLHRADPSNVLPSPSGTVTFLFTDIEGSSRLWEQFPDSMAAALARHDKILEEAIDANKGRVFSTAGDGRAAAFGTARDAMAAALAGQRGLGAEEWGVTGPLRVRMGLHTGQAKETDGDYLGPTVNRAARLTAVAHGGQVLCSRATAEVIGDDLPEGAGLIELGEHRLRDLTRPENVLQLTHPILLSDFPPLQSLDTFPTNLPAQTTSFVGREHQLAQIATALEAARVVTLTGVGGVGKTRLAVEAAAHVLPHYRDGAWFVELAPTVDSAAVVEVVATALGVTQRQGQTLRASLLDFLRGKRLLLLLDNCEHLIEAAARFTDEAIHSCPHVRVLATSREALGVGGERIIAVPSLELPEELADEAEAHRDAEATRLFAERAAEAKVGFALTEQNQAAVAQLCRRLDGIPLAIELAAARVRSLTPAELAERLDERFRLLTWGPRTAPERHQTLRRAIDWSYELLTEVEQRTLNRVAVFAGGFGLDAAEAIVVGGGIARFDVVDLLGRLVEKSLVLAEEQQGTTRYRLLDTIRRYALERLEAAGESDALRRRHAEHYADFATVAGAGLRGPREVTWSARVETELDNLRAGLAWSVAAGDAGLALGLVAPLTIAGTWVGYTTGRWADDALTMPDASRQALYPEILAWAGWAAAVAGDAERGVRLTHEALEIAAGSSLDAPSMCRVYVRVLGAMALAGKRAEAGRLCEEFLAVARSSDDYDLAAALMFSALPLAFVGDNSETLVLLDEAMVVARRTGNPSLVSNVAMFSGLRCVDTDPDRAQELFDEALGAAAPVGNHLAVTLALAFSAFIYLARGDWQEAASRLVHATGLAHRVGDSFAVWQLLLGMVTVLAIAGADEAAALTYGAARAHENVSGSPFDITGSSSDRHLEARAALLERVGEDRFAAWVERGADMDQDDLVALIRGEVEPMLVEEEEGLSDAVLRSIGEFRKNREL